MSHQRNISPECGNGYACFGFWSALLLVALIYSNSITVPWYMDDFHAIVDNPSVHLSSITFDSIKQALGASSLQSSIFRPVAYLSFALNWYFSNNGSVESFHIVNILLHIFNTFLLFCCISLIFETPALKQSYTTDTKIFVALFSSLLWALHPVHVQAVTYIVQRMALLAAFFYLISMIFFIKARMTANIVKQSCFYSACIISFLLALGSKQNTIMLPFVLIIVDSFFFGSAFIKKKKYIYAATIALILGFSFAWLSMNKSPFEYLAALYKDRPYSLYERVLTEPRIVIFYISQLLYPVLTRFSLVHDYPLSTGLFSPPTTFFALIAVIMLFVAGFSLKKYNLLASFAILFFLINHVVESTVLPIELIFEHRNYLPSMFLFVPVILYLFSLIKQYMYKNRFMAYFLVTSLCVLAVSLGSTTYARNMDWANPKKFWRNTARFAPKNARPHIQLGIYMMQLNKPDEAIKEFKEAIVLYKESKTTLPALYSYLSAAFTAKGEFNTAIRYAHKALMLKPGLRKAFEQLAYLYLISGKPDSALIYASNLISDDPGSYKYIQTYGITMYLLGRYDEATKKFRKCIEMHPGVFTNYYYLSMCHLYSGDIRTSQRILSSIARRFPDQWVTLLGLALNRIMANDYSTAESYMKNFIEQSGLNESLKFYQDVAGKSLHPELRDPRLIRLFRESFESVAQSLAG